MAEGGKVATLGVVGVGTISSAIVRGLCSHPNPPFQYKVYLSPRNAARTSALVAEFPSTVVAASSNQDVLQSSQIVFVAVLPDQLQASLHELQFRPDHFVVSLVAGVSHTKLCSMLPTVPSTNICCAVPLPPVAVQAGVTLLYSTASSSTSSSLATVQKLFDALGQCVIAKTEQDMSKLPTMTCMMGSYYMYLRTCLEWLEEQGVDRVTAARYAGCVMHSISRDGQLAALRESGEGEMQFQQLINEQTKGGYNEQGIRELVEAGVFVQIKHTLASINARWEGRPPPPPSASTSPSLASTPTSTSSFQQSQQSQQSQHAQAHQVTAVCKRQDGGNGNGIGGGGVGDKQKQKGKCPVHQPQVIVPVCVFVGYLLYSLFRPRRAV